MAIFRAQREATPTTKQPSRATEPHKSGGCLRDTSNRNWELGPMTNTIFEDRISENDTMDDLLAGFDGDDTVIEIDGTWDYEETNSTQDLDDDDDRLSGGMGDDVLFIQA